MSKSVNATLILAAAIVLAGCDDPAPVDTAERVRAIKSYTVTERAGADQRRYSGTLAASDTSGLAFAVSGTVVSVEVSQGDQVTAGDVLAQLDPEPFDLNVQAAEAEQTSAQAQFAEKSNNLDRQTELFEKGWVARAALDQAVAAYDAAEAELNVARTRLGTARRDQTHTVLLSLIHTSEPTSPRRNSDSVLCLKKKTTSSTCHVVF